MAHLVTLIEAQITRGKGVPNSPTRTVTQWFTTEGTLVVERDEWREQAAMEVAHEVYEGRNQTDGWHRLALIVLGDV